MAYGKSGKGTQAEIDKCREEGNWKRVVELSEQSKASRLIPDNLSNFLIGEAKLELYLEQCSSLEKNTAGAKRALADARKYLDLCINEKKEEVALDALLILAKLEFVCGNYQPALKLLTDAGLQNLTEKILPARSLRIVAESFTIEALCLEKASIPYNPKYQQGDKEKKISRCLELAGNLTLLYLQEQDKLASTPSLQSLPPLTATLNTRSTSPLPPNGPDKKFGFLLETALQRAPLVHLKAGQLTEAVDRYRSLLMAVESSYTQEFRPTITRQLAEVLLRGMSEYSYTPPAKESGTERIRNYSNLRAIDNPWKPRKYSGNNLFVPRNLNEEIILLLLISEVMAVREAVLTQSPEHGEAKNHSFQNASSVYDLLCIILAKRKQFQILVEVFERAMNFSYEKKHVWEQFGYSLACDKQLSRSLLVLKEARRLQPDQPHICLLGAKICFQQLGRVDEGLQWVERAFDALGTNNRSSMLSGRCHVYQGLGFAMKAAHSHRHSEAQNFREKSFQAFNKAEQLDNCDHLTEFYLAFYCANARQISDALKHVKLALQLRPDHLPSLMLLILLLSAQKEYDEALLLTKATAVEYPENLTLLYIKAYLEEEVEGCEVALLTAKHLLELWNELYKDNLSGDNDDMQSVVNDSYSVFSLSDKDTVSIQAESVAASRVEAALSEVASSLSSYHPRPGPHQAWILQINIWLLVAQLYLKTDSDTNEAWQCIQEASSIFPMSHDIMFMRGQLHEKKNEFYEALSCYQCALAINPYHTKCLRHMGAVYHYVGKNYLAEKTLLDAVRIDPSDHLSWAILAEVTESLEHLEVSSAASIRALDIQQSSPVLPFSVIPFCFD